MSERDSSSERKNSPLRRKSTSPRKLVHPISGESRKSWTDTSSDEEPKAMYSHSPRKEKRSEPQLSRIKSQDAESDTEDNVECSDVEPLLRSDPDCGDVSVGNAQQATTYADIDYVSSVIDEIITKAATTILPPPTVPDPPMPGCKMPLNPICVAPPPTASPPPEVEASPPIVPAGDGDDNRSSSDDKESDIVDIPSTPEAEEVPEENNPVEQMEIEEPSIDESFCWSRRQLRRFRTPNFLLKIICAAVLAGYIFYILFRYLYKYMKTEINEHLSSRKKFPRRI